MRPPCIVLDHNNRVCAPYPTTLRNHPFWFASPLKRKAPTTPAPAFDARSAVGRPAKTTDGVVPAGMLEHVRYRGSVPRVPSSMDFDAVPFV
jgi:hypothetical protein